MTELPRQLERDGGCEGGGSVVPDGVVSTGASTLAALSLADTPLRGCITEPTSEGD